MRLSLTFQDGIGGAELANFSHNGEDITATTGEHGFESLTLNVPLSLEESFYYYDRLGNAWGTLSNGARNVWEGQVEKVGVIAGGISIEALGVWRCLSRAKYTALWSDTSYTSWETLTTQLTKLSPQMWTINYKNGIYAAQRKNESFDYDDNRMMIGFQVPDKSSRLISGISFDYVLDMPSGWRLGLSRRDEAYGYYSQPWALSSSGAALTGSMNKTLSDSEGLTLELTYLGGSAPQTPAGDTGDWYVLITNIRVVTSTTNRINTTTTTTISAGSQVVTPASMTGIYVGQRLFIDESQATSESVDVTAVTSTTFTATFVNAYSGTTTIHAHVVKAQEIISDLASTVSALDGSYLSGSTSLIEDSGYDLTDEIYEDANPQDIATKMAEIGDSDEGNIWETGVVDDQLLYFRERTSAGRTWYVDPIDLSVIFDMGSLYNEVYGTYRNQNGRTLRTDTQTSENSKARHGAAVQNFVRSDNRASSSTTGAIDGIVTVHLYDGATPAPQVSLGVDRVFNPSGGLHENYEPRVGDTVVMRSLSPTLSADIDRIRTFRLSGHSYTVDDDSLTLMPERPLPTLDRLLARRAEVGDGIGVWYSQKYRVNG